MRSGIDRVLLHAIYLQSVVRGGAAEPVPSCNIAGVATRPRVTKDLLSTHSQNKTQFIIVRVTALAEDSVRNGEKQKLCRPVPQNANPGVRKNLNCRRRCETDLRLRILDSRRVHKAVPLGVFNRSATFVL